MGKKVSSFNERGLMDLFAEIRENDCHLRAKVLA